MHDAAGMVASNQRPIPLKTRPDLEVADVEYLGVGYRVVKDPVGLKYHRLQVEQYHVLDLLDGERSLEQVRDELKITYPTVQLQLSDIQQLITDLHKKGLLQTDRVGQAGALIRERRKEAADKLKQKLMSLLYFRLPGWDPEKTLQWLHPLVKWLWHPLAVTVCMLFVASAWMLLLVNFDVFTSKLPEFEQFFGWPNLIYMWATLGAAKIIHEFGHGVSCKHYGGECHEMGVMLLVFSPCLYCDVTDSWMLKSKWQRIIIAAAGMYIEVIISAAAIYVWWFTKPGMINYLALNTFFVTTITTVIFNANPLMRFDGYYMMSDFLEIPNLRAKSDKLLRENFGWYCLGIEIKPDPFMPETGKAWFITYAIAAWLYRWVILFSISLFLYTVLKPYDLQSLGVVLCIVSMSGIFFSMGKNLYQMVTAPRLEPLSKPKIAITCTIAALVVAAILSIRIPWHVSGPFIVEPQKVVEVKAEYAGRLLTPKDFREKLADLDADDPVRPILESGSDYTTRVTPDMMVQKDQVLAVLENRDIEEQLREAHASVVMYQQQMENYRKLNLEAQEEASRGEWVAAKEQRAFLANELKKRILRARVTGRVVAPPSRPEPKIDETTRFQPTQWHGTPLDARNANCYLQAGEHFCSIAPREDYELFIYMDQGDMVDVAVGDDVQLKFEHLAATTYNGKVERISQLDELYSPPPLSNKYGGELATVTDSQGREKLNSTAYRTIVRFDNDLELLRPGMRGSARFVVQERTTFQWGRRWFYETFRFRL